MNTEKLIKVQAGTTEMIHYSAKLAGRNRRPVCGTSSRMANFTEVGDSREVTCTKCEAPSAKITVREMTIGDDMPLS